MVPSHSLGTEDTLILTTALETPVSCAVKLGDFTFKGPTGMLPGARLRGIGEMSHPPLLSLHPLRPPSSPTTALSGHPPFTSSHAPLHHLEPDTSFLLPAGQEKHTNQPCSKEDIAQGLFVQPDSGPLQCLFYAYFSFFFLSFLTATHASHGSSQAKGQTRAVAASLHHSHSHSHTGSKLCL